VRRRLENIFANLCKLLEINNIFFRTCPGLCVDSRTRAGEAEFLHRLGDPANGVPPRLFIHERCARLVECLPSLQHDPNRPEDVLKVDADSR
jgi:hypothetical protein